MFFQPGKARFAEATAASTSVRSLLGKRPIRSSRSAGLRFSKVRPEAAGTHFPPIRLFCVSTAGELVVLEASDRFSVLHRYPLHELCHSTPAVALGRMFIRTEKHLWSLGGAKQSSAQ